MINLPNKYWVLFIRKPGKLNMERAIRLANETRTFRKAESMRIGARRWYYERYPAKYYTQTITKGLKHVAYAYGQYVDD